MLLTFNPGRNALTLLNDVTIMSIGSDVVDAILRRLSGARNILYIVNLSIRGFYKARVGRRFIVAGRAKLGMSWLINKINRYMLHQNIAYFLAFRLI